jgi:hypothetical protein
VVEGLRERMSTTTGFSRALTEDGLERFRDDPRYAALLQYCRADPSLSVFLRGKTIDVYWEGFVVFHVVVSSGKLQIGSTSDTPAPGWPTKLSDLDPAMLPEYIARVKDRRADKVATKVPELRFEAGVIRDNQAAGSPVVVLDRQVAGPGGKDQLDLMLLDAGSSRLALTELKVERNSEIAGPVLDQLERYVASFGALREQYAAILDQMKALGLVANRNATVDLTASPIPVVMLAGVQVKKFGADADDPRLHALRGANAKKLSTIKGWDARLLLFPRHLGQSFAIPMSLADLPTVQQWCARNLSIE